jgi:hypothetical protein
MPRRRISSRSESLQRLTGVSIFPVAAASELLIKPISGRGGIPVSPANFVTLLAPMVTEK